MIGSGRVASILAPAFENAGHRCAAVYSLHLANAKKLADKLYDCQVLDYPDFSDLALDVILLAISDDALPEVIDQLVCNSYSVVAHTSGGIELSILARFGSKAGVCYPVQSFSAGRKLKMDEVPFCIEANSPETESILVALAGSLSQELYYLNSAQRRDLHVAAVFASNFTNYLLSCAWEYMHVRDVNTDLLLPLIKETIEKALEHDPRKVQTGPAVRGDNQVVENHLQRLSDLPAMQRLYRELSGSIQDFYRKSDS